MLLTYSLPQDWTYSVSTEWLTPDVELLHDNAPAEKVRFAWSATDPQTTGSLVSIEASRVSGVVPRGGCMLGMTVPAGLRVEIWGRRASDSTFDYNLGGNSQTQRTVRFDDGTIGLVWVFEPGLDPIVGYQVTLYNDVGGVALIAPAAAIDIGQLRVGPGVVIPHELGWSDGQKDPSIVRRTLGGQTQRVARQAWRVGKLRPAWGRVNAARGGALEGGMDWKQLIALLAKDPYVLLIPRWQDTDDAQKTAVFGLVSAPAIDHKRGPIYQMQDMGFEEVPAG